MRTKHIEQTTLTILFFSACVTLLLAFASGQTENILPPL